MKQNNFSDFTVGISTSALYKNIIDGMGHYTKQLINQFSSSSNISCNGFAFPLKNLNKLENINCKKNNYFKYSYSYYMLKSFSILGKNNHFNPNVDIFHCTDYRLIPMTCPTVTTLYDAIHLIHPTWRGRNALSTQLAAYFIKKSAKLATHVITISDHAAKDIIQHFKIPDKKISIIPLAIDDRWFSPIEHNRRDEVRKKYDLPENYFLSVGTIQPRKNFDRLIDAYLSLPGWLQEEKKLVIVGKYGWNSELLLKKMQYLEEQKKIIWLSNVHSDEDLRYIYADASMFIFPSLYEGFGLPITEAFASKIPVICSNTTSLPEVSNGAALEINPESVAEIADAIQLLATNNKERDERIKQGYSRAAQFRWEDVVNKTVAVYRQVLCTY